MAYGLKYYSEFANALRLLDGSTLNEVFRFEIAEKDYTGESREITLGTPQPAIKYDEAEDLGFGIMATSLEFTLIAKNNLEFSDLIEANDTSYTVKLLKLENGAFVALFAGYLAPSGISRPYKNPNYTISCTAVDGLNNLKKNTILTSYSTLRYNSVFGYFLAGILGFRWDAFGAESLLVEFDILAENGTIYDPTTFSSLSMSGSNFIDKNNFEILEEILKAFFLRMYYYKGWRIERVANYNNNSITYKSIKTFQLEYLPVEKSMLQVEEVTLNNRVKLEGEEVLIYQGEESRENGLKSINIKQAYNPTKDAIPFKFENEYYRYNQSTLFNQPRFIASVEPPTDAKYIGIKSVSKENYLFIEKKGQFLPVATFESDFNVNSSVELSVNLAFVPTEWRSAQNPKNFTDVEVILQDSEPDLNSPNGFAQYWLNADGIGAKNVRKVIKVDVTVEEPKIEFTHLLSDFSTIANKYLKVIIKLSAVYSELQTWVFYTNYIKKLEVTKNERRYSEWDGIEIQYAINKDNRNENKKIDIVIGQYMQDDEINYFGYNEKLMRSRYYGLLYVTDKPVTKMIVGSLLDPVFEGKHLFLLANEIGNLNGRNRLVISGFFSKYIEPFNTIRVVGNKTLYFKGGTFDVINNRIDGEFIEIPEEELTYWVDQKKNKVITEEGKYIIVKMYGRNTN